MRILVVLLASVISIISISSCKSSSASASFCDTACLLDTLKFTGEHPLKPYVYISAKNCHADSIIWSYKGMGVNRKTGFSTLISSAPNINKNFIRCYIRDTAYAWLLFNDCSSGRGYQLRLPFRKSESFVIKSSGINNLDPKFAVPDNLIAYTDRGNIYIEDMSNGKKAMMTFGKTANIDYDNIHESLDSVNITGSHIWVKVKIDGKWETHDKDYVLE